MVYIWEMYNSFLILYLFFSRAFAAKFLILLSYDIRIFELKKRNDTEQFLLIILTFRLCKS